MARCRIASGTTSPSSPPHGNPPDELEAGVLVSLPEMKPGTVLLIVGFVYTYAMIRTKALLESPNRLTLCEYVITKRACSVLAKF